MGRVAPAQNELAPQSASYRLNRPLSARDARAPRR